MGVRDARVWVLDMSHVDRENGEEFSAIQRYVLLHPKTPEKGNLIIASENTIWLWVDSGTH